MSFRLISSSKRPTGQFAQGSSITIGAAVYDIGYDSDGVSLKRRQ